MVLQIPIRTVVLLGKENRGKTQLAISLASALSTASNFRVCTINCDSSRVGDGEQIDISGLRRSSDIGTLPLALERLQGDDIVRLVARGSKPKEDLVDLRLLTTGRLGTLVVPLQDPRVGMEAKLRELSLQTGLSVDASDHQGRGAGRA